jgi:hypothetical protein
VSSAWQTIATSTTPGRWEWAPGYGPGFVKAARERGEMITAQRKVGEGMYELLARVVAAGRASRPVGARSGGMGR